MKAGAAAAHAFAVVADDAAAVNDVAVVGKAASVNDVDVTVYGVAAVRASSKLQVALMLENVAVFAVVVMSAGMPVDIFSGGATAVIAFDVVAGGLLLLLLLMFLQVGCCCDCL